MSKRRAPKVKAQKQKPGRRWREWRRRLQAVPKKVSVSLLALVVATLTLAWNYWTTGAEDLRTRVYQGVSLGRVEPPSKLYRANVQHLVRSRA